MNETTEQWPAPLFLQFGLIVPLYAVLTWARLVVVRLTCHGRISQHDGFNCPPPLR